MDLKNEIIKLLEAYGCFKIHNEDGFGVVYNQIRDEDLVNDLFALYGVVGSKNVLKDYQEAYDYHNQIMKEVEPLSREYFIHYGRREGFRNAIELMTGTEM